MLRGSQPEYAVHSSLGLQSLCQALGDSPACHILELGPARNENLKFWSRFNPRMHIADLRSSLPLPSSPSEDEEWVGPDWGKLLELPPHQTCDVILAWDLFNYLELPAISSLVQYLVGYCHRGTILFALIFDQKMMPDAISLYDIADESHLRYGILNPQTRSCPRHQPRVLSGMMAGFQARESFRLRNGVIEYLFEYKGEQ